MDDSVKSPKEPLVTVISALTKLLVASLEVKVSASEASLDVKPSAPSPAVIVMVGAVLSNVQLNWVAAVLLLPTASVNVDPATSIVTAPSVVGVNVAV